MPPQPPGPPGACADDTILMMVHLNEVIDAQQAQIETLKRERAWLATESERLSDLLVKAEINEDGLQQRLGELQEVVMRRRPAPPPDNSWRTRIRWAMSIMFATPSPDYDIW